MFLAHPTEDLLGAASAAGADTDPLYMQITKGK